MSRRVDARRSIWESGPAKEAAGGRRAGSCGIRSRQQLRRAIKAERLPVLGKCCARKLRR